MKTQQISEVVAVLFRTISSGGTDQSGSQTLTAGLETLLHKKQAKATKNLFAGVIVPRNDELDNLLEKFNLKKGIRVSAWVAQFAHNERHPKNNRRGHLNAQEIQDQHLFWIKIAQQNEEFPKEQLRLNLQKNIQRILEFHDRIQEEYPDSHLYARKLVEQAHFDTLHGSVGSTISIGFPASGSLANMLSSLAGDAGSTKQSRMPTHLQAFCLQLDHKPETFLRSPAVISLAHSSID